MGIGAHESYKAMCEGKSGISRLPAWADEFPAQVHIFVNVFPYMDYILQVVVFGVGLC